MLLFYVGRNVLQFYRLIKRFFIQVPKGINGRHIKRLKESHVVIVTCIKVFLVINSNKTPRCWKQNPQFRVKRATEWIPASLSSGRDRQANATKAILVCSKSGAGSTEKYGGYNQFCWFSLSYSRSCTHESIRIC